MKKYLFAILFCGISLMSFAQVSQAERQALIDLYNATDGANWINTLAGDSQWQINDPSSDVSTWYGVEVINNKVVKLSLFGNNLSGDISTLDISGLQSLEELLVFNNNLSGTIPDSLTDVISLKTVLLGQNELSGTIPEAIGNLTSLQTLSFYDDNLSGDLPSTMANLVNLEVLQLGLNNFSGSLNVLGGLNKLRDLRVEDNQFNGAIPESFGSLPLEIFVIRNNQFSGNISDSLTNVTSLKTFLADGNQLTGSLPSTIGNLQELVSLNLKNNNFSGSIPSSITQLSKLTGLFIDGNNFSGKIPDLTITPITSLFINDNNFVFSDFESEFIEYSNRMESSFRYDPQAKVDQEETISVVQGQTITLTSNLLTSENNEYKWYKDGVTIPNATAKELVIENATESDAGVYIFRATNSIVTGLQLERNPITLTVTPNNDCVSAAERQALIDFYNATNGDAWTNTTAGNQPWLVNDPTSSVCDWFGIIVGDGKVTQINLPVNNLSGSIPASIDQLSGLRAIYLGSNDFSGSELPIEIGSLFELRSLRINNCKFEGTFPVQLTQLSELHTLRAEKNNFTGSLPPELGQLKKLQVLDLHQNQLSGAIPTEIGGLESLTYLRMFSNQLTGQLPSSLGNLTNLGTLNLGGNPFTSTLPKELGQLKNLVFLSLNNCGLYGEIPAELSGMTSIRTISMYNNQFTGAIPSSFESLSTLENLALQGNNLSSSIPEELGNLVNLKTLVLYSNQLSGTIPASLGQLSNLTTLRIEANQLEGTIPTSFNQLQSLTRLNLHTNKLEGKVPVNITNLPSLTHLTVQNNKFVFSDIEDEFISNSSLNIFNYSPQAKVDQEETLSVVEGGSITLTSNVLTSNNNSYQWFKNGVAISNATSKELLIENATEADTGTYIFKATNSIVSGLELQRNPITLTVTASIDCVSAAERQALIDLYSATNGDNWTNTVAGNKPWLVNDPTSSVCDWYGITVREGKVVTIGLGNNNLIGSIPNSIGNLAHVEILGMIRNQLTGSIPSSIGSLNQLRNLGLNANQLTGSIPAEIGQLTNLLELNLSVNQLSGSMPESIGNLKKLQRLNFTINRLEGAIPTTFGNLESLTYIGLGRNLLTDSIPSELGNLSNLVSLNLNENRLTGSIPSSIGQLSELTTLVLYTNELSGAIPVSLGGLTKLTTLNIRTNKLSNDIPEELGNLTNLEVCYLYGNELTGPIPNSFRNLSVLRILALGENQLNGEIPGFLGELPLTILQLQNNNFIGPIPVELGNLINLKQLRLSNNQLTDSIPNSLSGLTSATELFFDGNQFSQKIPNFLSIESLTRLYIDTNKFVFSDFEEEFERYRLKLGTGFSYIPQAKVDEIENLSVEEGKEIILTTKQLTSENNSYVWFKNGVEITGITGKELVISNASIDDAGVYTFKATNSIITDLELERLPITLTVTESLDCVSAGERQALIDFYNATYGDNWINTRQGNQPWLINDSTSSVCDWYGVIVTDGKVTGLDLEANNLGVQNDENTPEDLSSLQGLIHLEILRLPKNNLSGSIPAFLGDMMTLTHLRLNQNQFTGNIPPELGKLKNLIGLQLYSNQLTGSIPVELSQLESILYLSLAYNQLTGTIPVELSALKNTLQQLHLMHNQLTGSIPKELGLLSKLAILNLNSNQLSGSIPKELGDLLKLNQLWLDVNQLSGAIPSELGNFPRINSLKLNTNQLTGDIPIELTQLSTVKVFYLFDNQLTGNIYPEFGDMTSLVYFDISNNQLDGGIPTTFANLNNAKLIKISENNLTGTIPLGIGKLPVLEFFIAGDNRLEGTIPSDFAESETLKTIHFSKNDLRGKIPDLNGIPSLTRLYFSYNNFIFSDFEYEFVAYRSKLEQFVYEPQAKVDSEETRTVNSGESVTLSTDQLISNNNSYQWYKDGVAIPDAIDKEYTITSVSEADAGVYYFLATNSVVTGLTLERNTITLEISEVLGDPIQYFCSSEYSPAIPTVNDIVSPILGDIQWYTDQFEGDLLNKEDPLGEYDLYWADNGFGVRSSVEVILDQGAPNIPTYQEFSRQSNATVADLDSESIEVKWYATVSSTTELSATELLENGKIYYASNNNDACRTAVYVFVGTLVPDGSAWQVFCENQNPLVGDLEMEGTNIKWYTSKEGTEVLNTLDALVSGTTYYATQNDGVEESVERKAVFVNIIKTPPPTGTTLQQIKTDDVAKVSDLVVFGSNIKWYDRPEGGDELINEYVLEDGKTYYATQTIACESVERFAVTVTIVPKDDLELVDCIKFRPDPGKSYIVSAWVREDDVIAQPTEVVYFNNQTSGNSEFSQLFVNLLNELLDRVMRQKGVPEVYTPDPEQRRYDPLVQFLSTTSSDNFTIYNFENIKEAGLTVGFSFYLDKDKTRKFVFKTPYVRRSTFIASYRYPLIVKNNFENSNDYIRVNFKTAKPCENDICITYDIEVKATNQASTGGWSAQNLKNYEEYEGSYAYYNEPGKVTLNEVTRLNTGIKSEIQKYNYIPDPNHQAAQYENAVLQMTFENNADGGAAIPVNQSNIELQPLGPVIKGWQRVAAQFEIPLNATDMFISLRNKNESGTNAYFDDIRIHPFNSNVKSFVYDPVTQRLMAELDENNYATFYEYDKEGGLVRVKKETEEGVYTIQETRSGNYKNNSINE